MKKWIALSLLCGMVFGGGVKEDFTIGQDETKTSQSYQLIFQNGNSDKEIKIDSYGDGLRLSRGSSLYAPLTGIRYGGGDYDVIPAMTWPTDVTAKYKYDAVNAGQIYTLQTNLQKQINNIFTGYITIGGNDGKILGSRLYFDYGFTEGADDKVYIVSDNDQNLIINPHNNLILGGNKTITTELGDLILNPNGNINCSDKTLANVGTITASGKLTLNPDDDIDCSENQLLNVTAITSSGSLALNPPYNRSVIIGGNKKVSASDLTLESTAYDSVITILTGSSVSTPNDYTSKISSYSGIALTLISNGSVPINLVSGNNTINCSGAQLTNVQPATLP